MKYTEMDKKVCPGLRELSLSARRLDHATYTTIFFCHLWIQMIQGNNFARHAHGNWSEGDAEEIVS